MSAVPAALAPDLVVRYGTIQSGFWLNPDVQKLTEKAKLMACYLLTCSHGNSIGCFYLPNAYVEHDLGLKATEVSKGYSNLYQYRFAIHDTDSSNYVYIRNFMRWNPTLNPKMQINREKLWSALPDDLSFKVYVAQCFLEFTPDLIKDTSKSTLNQFISKRKLEVSIPFRNNYTKTKTKLDSNRKPTAQSAKLATIAKLPTNNGEPFDVLEDQAGVWQGQFPGVDVGAELLKIQAWLDANPTRRKTHRGMSRFVVGWLSRQQDRA